MTLILNGKETGVTNSGPPSSSSRVAMLATTKSANDYQTDNSGVSPSSTRTTANAAELQVRNNVIKRQLDQHAALFELSPSGDCHHRDRLCLNRQNADHVASFLRSTPHIKGLSVVSNIQRLDGAMQIMTQLLHDTVNLNLLCLWGDGDDDDDDEESDFPTNFHDEYNNDYHHITPVTVNSPQLQPNVDDGSMLECVSLGLPGNTFVNSLRFHFYNFSKTRGQHGSGSKNRDSLHRLLCHKRDFEKLIFSACNFGSTVQNSTTPTSANEHERKQSTGSNISFLLEGLAAQQKLQELSIDMEDFESNLRDEELVQLIQMLQKQQERRTTKLRTLNLYDCGMGPLSFHALTVWLSQPTCPIVELSLGGTRRLLQTQNMLRRQFLSSLCYTNCSIQRIQVTSYKHQRAFQQILQLCAQRNRSLAKVRTSLQRQVQQRTQQQEEQATVCEKSDLSLALWGKAIGTLSRQNGFASSTAIFTVITSLAPQLADNARSKSVRRPSSTSGSTTCPLPPIKRRRCLGFES